MKKLFNFYCYGFGFDTFVFCEYPEFWFQIFNEWDICTKSLNRDQIGFKYTVGMVVQSRGGNLRWVLWFRYRYKITFYVIQKFWVLVFFVFIASMFRKLSWHIIYIFVWNFLFFKIERKWRNFMTWWEFLSEV